MGKTTRILKCVECHQPLQEFTCDCRDKARIAELEAEVERLGAENAALRVALKP